MTDDIEKKTATKKKNGSKQDMLVYIRLLQIKLNLKVTYMISLELIKTLKK